MNFTNLSNKWFEFKNNISNMLFEFKHIKKLFKMTPIQKELCVLAEQRGHGQLCDRIWDFPETETQDSKIETKDSPNFGIMNFMLIELCLIGGVSIK